MKRTISRLPLAALFFALTSRVVSSAEPVLELVMRPGMSIAAETQAGSIVVSAGSGLDRTYSWEGTSRSATLWPRDKRWYGSLGAYYPGPGEHWSEHHGITRGVLQEGQQHFDSDQEAIDWLRTQSGYFPTVYRDDGLVVSFGKKLSRRQINVEIWQIFVDGAKPRELPGSDNSKIKVTNSRNQRRRCSTRTPTGRHSARRRSPVSLFR